MYKDVFYVFLRLHISLWYKNNKDFLFLFDCAFTHLQVLEYKIFITAVASFKIYP